VQVQGADVAGQFGGAGCLLDLLVGVHSLCQ